MSREEEVEKVVGVQEKAQEEEEEAQWTCGQSLEWGLCQGVQLGWTQP